MVACRSSTRRQGLTFTSARVLARALLRASGYLTFGTPITSRPWTGGLSALSCPGELCNCNRAFDCRGNVWALSPANVRSQGPGTSRAGASGPRRSSILPLLRGFLLLQGVSHRRRVFPLPATLLSVSRHQGLLPGEGECSTARGSSLCLRPRPRCCAVSSVPVSPFPVAGAAFLTCPVSPWHDLLFSETRRFPRPSLHSTDTRARGRCVPTAACQKKLREFPPFQPRFKEVSPITRRFPRPFLPQPRDTMLRTKISSQDATGETP